MVRMIKLIVKHGMMLAFLKLAQIANDENDNYGKYDNDITDADADTDADT